MERLPRLLRSLYPIGGVVFTTATEADDEAPRCATITFRSKVLMLKGVATAH